MAYDIYSCVGRHEAGTGTCVVVVAVVVADEKENNASIIFFLRCNS